MPFEMLSPRDKIRPDSALAAEPALADELKARLPSLQAAAEAGRKSDRQILENAVDTYSLLAAYPWRRLNYRWGRWEAAVVGWKALITCDVWESYHWVRNEDNFQVLDPQTGQVVGELITQGALQKSNGAAYAAPEVLPPPAGTLEFAGDPGAIGVYRYSAVTADGIRLTGNRWMNSDTLRAGIADLRSGVANRLPPPYLTIDHQMLDKYRAWDVDEPDKPARKAPYASQANSYFPGRRILFSRSRRPKSKP